ncbi:MAG: hypothetical protein D4R88_08280 [Methanosarcinales archaeon]|nr:MAG: hypothetical protein D4R88_08280 [Methanosarcinales archaeon]
MKFSCYISLKHFFTFAQPAPPRADAGAGSRSGRGGLESKTCISKNLSSTNMNKNPMEIEEIKKKIRVTSMKSVLMPKRKGMMKILQSLI